MLQWFVFARLILCYKGSRWGQGFDLRTGGDVNERRGGGGGGVLKGFKVLVAKARVLTTIHSEPPPVLLVEDLEAGEKGGGRGEGIRWKRPVERRGKAGEDD